MDMVLLQLFPTWSWSWKAAEETSETNLDQTKTQRVWSIWSFHPHFGATDQDIEVIMQINVKAGMFETKHIQVLEMQQALLCGTRFIYMSRPRPSLKFKIHTNCSASFTTKINFTQGMIQGDLCNCPPTPQKREKKRANQAQMLIELGCLLGVFYRVRSLAMLVTN